MTIYSSDNTPFLAQKNGVRVVKEKKQGLTYARNKGFDTAKYEIIARCDADVIVPPDWIKKIKLNFQKHKIDALTGPFIYYDFGLISPKITKIHTAPLRAVIGGNYAFGPNTVITKDMWNKVRGLVSLDGSLVHEDVDLSINIIRAKGKIGYDPSLIVKTSARRIKQKPFSFFVEYPIRLFKTLWINRT